MVWSYGELLILCYPYDILLLSAMVHLLGGSVYLMNLILLNMSFECGFEGLVHEMNLYLRKVLSYVL